MSLITRGLGKPFSFITRGLGYVEISIPLPSVSMFGIPSSHGYIPREPIKPITYTVKLPVRGTLLVKIHLVEQVIGTLSARIVLKIQVFGTLGKVIDNVINVLGTLQYKTARIIRVIGQKSLRAIKLLLTILEEDEE